MNAREQEIAQHAHSIGQTIDELGAIAALLVSIEFSGGVGPSLTAVLRAHYGPAVADLVGFRSLVILRCPGNERQACRGDKANQTGRLGTRFGEELRTVDLDRPIESAYRSGPYRCAGRRSLRQFVMRSRFNGWLCFLFKETAYEMDACLVGLGVGNCRQ
jgi:hypothetical protein